MNMQAKQFILLFGAILTTSGAARAFAQSAEEQAVLAPIHAMFDGMSKRDAAAIKAPTLPGGTMVLMRDGKPAQMTFDTFADRVGKPSKSHIEERIHNPLVRIDNDLAVVWAPFDFLIDGKIDHCGTDLFNLVRVDGRWIIASVTDTGTKACSVKMRGCVSPDVAGIESPISGANGFPVTLSRRWSQ
ncbi:MAG: nuclear transport factor 2 family protein, partial [Acidobacteriaceae bacterium]|nr:nuclear transport factor 2 family protein [Acidobacteriaceae bacterium]